MRRFPKLGSAILAGAICLPLAALAAAPDALDDAAPAAKTAPALMAPLEHRLDTEMVVRGWVLCISQGFAETLAKARSAGIEEALAAYEGLKSSKSCGQVSQLTVILHKSLYASAADVDTQVFRAAVNIAGRWANAFVVEGSLPAEQ